MDTSRQFWLHNGYCGWSYGTPSNPQLVSAEDAIRIMSMAGLTMEAVSTSVPAATYAEEGDHLFRITGCNRFLFYGTIAECADTRPTKVAEPMAINWAAA